jgi:8-oxo-dGTP diphosphatase
MPVLPKPSRFTVRIYGFLLSPENELLLSHEKLDDFSFSKFPGGGLELGEGPIDCLIREFKEEMDLNIHVIEHVYTSDFYIQSEIEPEEQVIGIYYLVAPHDYKHLDKINTEIKPQPFRGKQNLTGQKFHSLSEITENDLTFNMDKAALNAFRIFLKRG